MSDLPLQQPYKDSSTCSAHAWKRGLDLVLTVSGLLLCWPLLVLLAAAVKLDSPGPILFRQWRMGRDGQPFLILKFRSMVDGAEALQDHLRHLNEQDGPTFKLQDDPRATMVGRWLRWSALDELPQLWNVLLGEMSLVGPRPLCCREVAGCLEWHLQRHRVRPGITGLWQIHEPTLSFDAWMRLDLEYIQRCSPWLDLRILLATPVAILRRRRPVTPGFLKDRAKIFR